MAEENNDGLSMDDIDLFGDMANMLSGVDDEGATSDTEEVVNTSTEEDIEDEETNTSEGEDESDEDDSVENTEEDAVQNDEDITDNDDSSSPLIPYAKMLVEDSILPNFNVDEYDGTADGLKKAMINEISAGVDYYKSSLPQEVKSLIDSYEAGVPFNDILKIKSDQIRFANIKEEDIAGNDDNQKDIMKEYYKRTTKFSDERITKSVDRLFESGELEDEAKLAVKELVGIQQQEEDQAKAKAQEEYQAYIKSQEDQLQYAKDYIAKSDEIIPNIKVSDVMKDKIVKNLTVPVGYDANGNPVSKVSNYLSQNPVESEILINYLYELTGGFKDFSTFGRVGKSKAINELEAAAKGLDSKSKTSSSKKKSSSSNTEFFSELKRMGL